MERRVRPGRCAVYLRVSTQKPDQEHGLEAQLLACQQFLERQGFSTQDLRVYREQASGRKTDRPVLRKMLQEGALHKFQVLATFRLDRLSRGGISQTFELLRALKDHGIRVYSVSEEWFDPDSPTHELVLAVLSWAAQFESRSIGERVAAGIAARRVEAARKGKPFLWGRARVSVLVRDPAMPAKALRLRQGGASWTQIAAELRIGRTTARRLCVIARTSEVMGTGKKGGTGDGGPRAG